MNIKGKNTEIKKVLQDTIGYFRKRLQIERIANYAELIDMVMTDYNKKSCQETMMIKSYRSSSQETTVRKTHMENHAAMVAYAAKKIRLNVKVASLMSKHHDIGHTFLGHSGEWWISDVKEDYGMGCCVHNAIGVRELEYRHEIYEEIVNKIKTSDPSISEKELGRVKKSLWLILDAINSHNGELSDREFFPKCEKTEEQYEEELLKCHTKEKFDKTIVPATTEACLMRLCDKISYIPSDMADGLREGFISGLDTEYIQILQSIGITQEEIDWAMAKKNYDEIAKRLKDIFLKDLIHNSTKKKVAMSEEVSKKMYQLLDKNNRETVNWTVLQEDVDTYPKAIRSLMTEYKDIILDNELLAVLNTVHSNQELNAILEEKYRGTTNEGFIQYICQTKPKDFLYSKKIVEEATKQSIQDELEMARNIVQGEEVKIDNTMPLKIKRVQAYIKYYEKEPTALQEKDTKLVERAMHNIQAKKCNENYISMEERLAIEIGSQYIQSLNDREFMDLICSKGIVTEEQKKSLTRKYKDFDYRAEVAKQTRWEGISKAQAEAAKGDAR